jgi:hypothetical protein
MLVTDASPLPEGPGDFAALRPRPSMMPVLFAGALSTAASLAIVHLCQQRDFEPMLWMIDYVIPGGALITGVVAATGFGFASWKLGTRISGKLLLWTVAILTAGYAGALILEYRRAVPGGVVDGAAISFFQWFDWSVRGVSFPQSNGAPGEPLEALGYGLAALGYLGFVAGGLSIPFGLRAKPFCDSCNRYMRSQKLAAMRTNLAHKMFGDKSPEREEQRAKLQAAAQLGLATVFAAADKDAASVRDAIAAHAPLSAKDAVGAPSRLEIKLVRCPGCHRGTLEAEQLVINGRNTKWTKLQQRPVNVSIVEGLASSS